MTRSFWTALAVATACTLPLAAQDSIKPVKLLTVASDNASNTRQFFGQVVARQTVDLAFQVGGQIVELTAVEGEVIPKGELVAQLDLEAFELSLQQAQLQEQQAQRVVSRYEKLQGGAVSQVSLEDAQTQLALVDVAVRNAEKALADATLHAPYDALVAERMIQNFTTISAGTAVVRLHDMSELRIEIDVPEVQFQRAGANPDVTATAQFPASDTVYPITLREYTAETSSVGQTFKLTFGMAPPDGLWILPGSSVTVTVALNDSNTHLTVPSTALTPDAQGKLTALVFTAAEDGYGTLSRVPVTVEPLATGKLQIIDGLSEGDEIVAMGAGSLQDGQKVRRFRAFG